MKKIMAALLLMVACGVSAQQQMRIWSGDGDFRASTSDIVFSQDGTTFSVDGGNYAINSVDSITMVYRVLVNYEGVRATVDLAGAPGVTCTVNGADVVINSENTSHELEFILQGSSSNGSLTYNGSYKCKFYLNGLDLTSATGAPLDIQCGKRISLILNPGTVNTLTDCAGGVQKAALYCKGHLEVEGSGTLSVSGNTRHAIATKEYLQLKKSTGTINIVKAAADGIHAGQYLLMGGGTISIDANTAADGIQVEALTGEDGITWDATKENNGKVFLNGGIITATITHEDCKGIKATGDMTITDGIFTLTAQGNGSRGIQVGGNMEVGGGTCRITASGNKCTVTEDRLDPHRCMGIKVDGNMSVTGGTILVNTPNVGVTKARAIRVKGTYSKTGGSVTGTVTQGE